MHDNTEIDGTLLRTGEQASGNATSGVEAHQAGAAHIVLGRLRCRDCCYFYSSHGVAWSR